MLRQLRVQSFLAQVLAPAKALPRYYARDLTKAFW
jgi:hypothetical protein